MPCVNLPGMECAFPQLAAVLLDATNQRRGWNRRTRLFPPNTMRRRQGYMGKEGRRLKGQEARQASRASGRKRGLARSLGGSGED